MARYLEIEEARGRPGLRLVLTAGLPAPWGEGARYLFDAKKIPYLRVRQEPGKSDEALWDWTRQTSAPVAILDDERPRSSWLEILHLAERLAPEPALIPEDPAQRVRMFGLLNELCGDQGLGWQRRLMLVQASVDAGRGEALGALIRKYGYSPEAAAAAPSRCAEILGVLAQTLREQDERGSRYLVGDRLSALDLYWAAFSQLVTPLGPPQSPAPRWVLESYAVAHPDVRAALDPSLLERRDFVFREHVGLPLDY